MEDKQRERLFFFDNAKGILIFLVVFGHFLLDFRSHELTRFFVDFIYLFHMPAFVFISGHLSRFVSQSHRSQLKIILTYFIFNFLMMIYATNYLDQPISMLTPYYSYWYLPALFFWRYLTPIIAGHRETFPIAIAASILVGFRPEFSNQLALSRIVGFFPFFLAGYLTSEIHIRNLVESRKPFHRWCGGLLLLACAVLFISVNRLNLQLEEFLFFPYLSPERMLVRILLIFFCLAVFAALAALLPADRCKIIGRWGRNSLAIYVLHRYIPFWCKPLLLSTANPLQLLLVALSISLLTTLILGIDRVSNKLNSLLNFLVEILDRPTSNQARIFKLSVALAFLLSLSSTVFFRQDQPARDQIHQVISAAQLNRIEKCIEISFVGDLILLRDMVRASYCEERKNYDFNYMFDCARPYLRESDFTIGVLEGPLAGEEKGFSTSNFDDGIPLYLNFPDAFAEAIKEAGIDLVTLANNHILDMGIPGQLRTIDLLDRSSIKHTGSYRNHEERNTVKIVDIKGLKAAILAYTIPSNYYSEKYFFEEAEHLTSVLVPKSSQFFSRALARVKQDFASAKSHYPDLIIVLPHMGTQFMHATDDFQNTWNEIFVTEGADIVLGDHSHAVQPLEFRKTLRQGKERNVLILNCPGNFVNSFIQHNGDATAIVKIFIDPDEKSIFAAGVVPMWTQGLASGRFRALPIFDAINSTEYRPGMLEMQRIAEVYELITEVMLNTRLSLDQAQRIHYLLPDGYHRKAVDPLDLSTKQLESLRLKDSFNAIASAGTIMFLGDSLTAGSKNGGYAWFEALTGAIFTGETLIEAHGGATTLTLSEKISRNRNCRADTFVIAVGTNDIRYRDPKICAMNSNEFCKNLENIVNKIQEQSPMAKFILVAPWPSLENDMIAKIAYKEKCRLQNEYTVALKNFCQIKGYFFADPTNFIVDQIERKPLNYYLKDHIHPNASEGIKLYSEAFLNSLMN